MSERRERERVADRLGSLVATLRAGGVRVGTGELLAAHRALAAVDAAAPREAVAALRATLCSSRADLEAFDAALPVWLGELIPEVVPRDPGKAARLHSVPGAEGADPGEEAPARDLVRTTWSSAETLRHKDFAAYTPQERERARRLVGRLARRGPARRSRRLRPAPHATRRGARHDTRRTLRAALRRGGEPLERRWLRHGERARPLVLLCDVSGSMAPYARMLLQYVHAAVAARRRVEAFAFGTRLTRITLELRHADPDRALARATGAVEDFSGGTRIGAALATLNREHGRRLGRGAIVVVLSDGWDRGEPETLAAEMDRLRRCSHRVIWLNPLKAHPGYEPLTRGMAAALPRVDHFMPGNTLASLEQLADLLEGGITT